MTAHIDAARIAITAAGFSVGQEAHAAGVHAMAIMDGNRTLAMLTWRQGESLGPAGWALRLRNALSTAREKAST